MEVEQKNIAEKAQIELTVSVTPEELEPYLEQAAKTLTEDKALKGFRPGKAPVAVVIEAFGKERVLHEALDKALPRLFMQAIVEHNIDALGQPSTSVTTLDLEDGLVFTATVDVLPNVKLGDVSTLKATRRVTNVTSEDVDRELAILAKSRSTYLDVARPAEKGDTAVVDFTVSMNGEPMEGGKSEQHPVHIGEGHFVPDFEEKLIGIQAGDTREFTITFPDDIPNESLRGKEAQAVVKAHAIKKRSVPEITDEFAQSLGSFKDVTELKEKFKENIAAEQKQKEAERVQGELAESLAESSTIPALPQSLIEREIDRRLTELQNLLMGQGKSFEGYLKEHKKELSDIRTELRPAAEKTVRVSLVLRAFAQENNVEVPEDEVEAKSQEFLQQNVRDENERAKVDQEQLRASVANTLRNQKVLAQLEERAEIEEVQHATTKKSQQKVSK